MRYHGAFRATQMCPVRYMPRQGPTRSRQELLMREAQRNRIRRSCQSIVMSLVVLMLSARAAAAQTDMIRGRVVGFDGQPLSGVQVTATSIPGNVTRESRTNAQGNYQI